MPQLLNRKVQTRPRMNQSKQRKSRPDHWLNRW